VHYVLLYDYVEDVLERRQPFRAEHLALASDYHERGVLLMAGAWTDPVDGAAFVFTSADTGPIDEFVERDPYVQNGLVTAWRVREWTVVIGGPPPVAG
jgi:uncharacterized protein YciI